MTKKQFYITVSLVCVFGFLLIIFVLFAEAASGKIIVYDDAGNVEHVEKFTYDSTPSKFPFPYRSKYRTAMTEEDEVEEEPETPLPPKGLHMIIEPEEEYIEEDEDEEYDRDREEGKYRDGRDWRGRRKKIIKIRSERVGNRQVTTYTRLESDKSQNLFRTKEVVIDNRFTGNRRQQWKASQEAPNSKRLYFEKQIPVYKRRGYP